MKKIYFILAAMLLAEMTGAVTNHLYAQESLPQWGEDLLTQNPDIIDSILYYDPDAQGPNTRTYVIYYHQPLNHSQSGSAQFPLRALITVHKDADPTKAVNHIYASGYSIMGPYLYRPDSAFHADQVDCAAEIAHRYRANFIQIEHRYYQFSAPAACWTNIDDLRAEEAAADFHNLFDALKKVLKGKYVMSGVSKGGIATLLQHKFYPNDMDIFVPYSAPFFNTDRDLELQKYWYNNGWSPYFRNIYMTIRENGLYNKETIFPCYLKMRGGAATQAKLDSVYWLYLASVAGFGFEDHAYSDTLSIRKCMYRNDSITNAKGVKPYSDTVYAFMFDKGVFDLSNFPDWIDTLRKYPDKKQAPQRSMYGERIRPFGVSEKDWWSGDTIDGTAYNYQAKRELGYFDYRFDMILEDPVSGQAYNDYWTKNAGCLQDLWSPFYSSLTFSPTLYNETMAATQNATKPIVLLYGLDDSWTGAAVKDQYINGSNVRKFILPAQNHMVAFSANTDRAQSDAIRAILDGVLGASEAIETVGGEQAPVVRKVLHNGQIYIIRGDKIYTIEGEVVSGYRLPVSE